MLEITEDDLIKYQYLYSQAVPEFMKNYGFDIIEDVDFELNELLTLTNKGGQKRQFFVVPIGIMGTGGAFIWSDTEIDVPEHLRKECLSLRHHLSNNGLCEAVPDILLTDTPDVLFARRYYAENGRLPDAVGEGCTPSRMSIDQLLASIYSLSVAKLIVSIKYEDEIVYLALISEVS